MHRMIGTGEREKRESGRIIPRRARAGSRRGFKWAEVQGVGVQGDGESGIGLDGRPGAWYGLRLSARSQVLQPRTVAAPAGPQEAPRHRQPSAAVRKSAVWGKTGSVRVEYVGTQIN